MNEDGGLDEQYRSESLSQSDQVMDYTYTGSYARPLTGGTMSGTPAGGGHEYTHRFNQSQSTSAGEGVGIHSSTWRQDWKRSNGTEVVLDKPPDEPE